MTSLAQFKKFLKTNLTHTFKIDGVFNGTLIDAYNLDKATAQARNSNKMPVMLRVMEMFRERRVDWWEHYQGRGSAWNVIQRNYTQLQIDKHNIPCSIIPYVKEIEQSQLMLCADSELVFCSSCYRIRMENASLKHQIAEIEARSGTRDDALAVCEPIPEARVLREWFEKNFHRNGKGHGYPRNRLRQDITEYLSGEYGYRAEISVHSPIWKWFVQNVVGDKTAQRYRAFRIWRKNT